MGALSKELRDELLEDLSGPWGMDGHLMCDADHLTLAVRPAGTLRFCIVVYVNGWTKAAWCNAKAPCHEQKYLRKRVVKLWKPADRAKLRKAMGARRFDADPTYNATFTAYYLDFASPRAVLAQLSRVCQSIRRATPTEIATTTAAVNAASTTKEESHA
jgi:hypothetical protein